MPHRRVHWVTMLGLETAVRTQGKIVVHCLGLRVNPAVLWHVYGTAAISIKVCAFLRNRAVFTVATNGRTNLSSSFTKHTGDMQT